MDRLRRDPPASLIPRSDRGVQDAATSLMDAMKPAGLIPSMIRRGNCCNRGYAGPSGWIQWSILKLDPEYHRDQAAALEGRGEILDPIEASQTAVELTPPPYGVFPSDLELKKNRPRSLFFRSIGAGPMRGLLEALDDPSLGVDLVLLRYGNDASVGRGFVPPVANCANGRVEGERLGGCCGGALDESYGQAGCIAGDCASGGTYGITHRGPWCLRIGDAAAWSGAPCR